MSNLSLTLGPVAFAGFELPSSIIVGGTQRLAIHRLPGGIRVIDALGPDPADIAFSGIFTGPDAADRARLLDALRVAGSQLPLSWGAFLYTIVIASFEADYRSPWWIPYRISCSVLRDEATAVANTVAQLASEVSSDLVAAGSLVASAAAALAVPGATIVGTAAYASATTVLTATVGSLDSQILTAQAALRAPDLSIVVGAAGLLAQLTFARGYTSRASRNLSSAST